MSFRGQIVNQESLGLYSLEEAIPHLQTGDVLLAMGAENDIVSIGIREVTRSDYTHAAMLRMDYGHPIIYEAVSEGTSDRHLRAWKKRNYQKVSVFRSEHLDVAAAMEYLITHKGEGYDFAQIGRIWWHELFPHVKHNEDPDISRVICSEYVSGALNAGGVDPSHKDDYYTYPRDLARSPVLEHVLDFTI